MAIPPKTVKCKRCDDEGEIFVTWDRDGFEYGRYWENCPDCKGGWHPPKEEDEKAATVCHTAQ